MTSPDLDAELREILGAPMTDSELARLDERLDDRLASARSAGIAATAPTAYADRHRRVIVLLAATVALLVATSVLTLGAPPPPDPAQQAADFAAEERVRNDVGRLMAGGCLDVAEATTLIRGRLDALGLSDWAIETRDGAQSSRCVSAAPVGDGHVVLLIPGMGGDVAKAMDRVATTLRRQCLGKDDATALIASELTALGATRWTIRTDGPLPVRIGDEQAVRDHIAAGCFVYAGTQSRPDGERVFYIVGP